MIVDILFIQRHEKNITKDIKSKSIQIFTFLTTKVNVKEIAPDHAHRPAMDAYGRRKAKQEAFLTDVTNCHTEFR